jgi:hypothetical protein
MNWLHSEDFPPFYAYIFEVAFSFRFALSPGKTTSTHCTGSWVAPGPVWISAEDLAPPGFDPQPVASSYTDYAIPAHFLLQFPLEI